MLSTHRRHMSSLFAVNAMGLSVPGIGQFFQLRNGSANTCLIHEVEFTQTSVTTPTRVIIRLLRGTGGTGGTALTEYRYDTAGQAPVAQGFSLTFTATVGSLDLIYDVGWDILGPMMFRPQPNDRIALKANDHFAMSLAQPTAMTLSCRVVWEEIGG